MVLDGISAIGKYVDDSVDTPAEVKLIHQPKVLEWWAAQIKSACSPSARKTIAWVFKDVAKVLDHPLLYFHKMHTN